MIESLPYIDQVDQCEQQYPDIYINEPEFEEDCE